MIFDSAWTRRVLQFNIMQSYIALFYFFMVSLYYCFASPPPLAVEVPRWHGASEGPFNAACGFNYYYYFGGKTKGFLRP